MFDDLGREVLLLHLKKEYYEAIKRREKKVEHRRNNQYWRTRLWRSPQYERVWFVKGFVKNNIPRLEADITNVRMPRYPITDVRGEPTIQIFFNNVIEVS